MRRLKARGRFTSAEWCRRTAILGRVERDGLFCMQSFLVCIWCYHIWLSDYFDFGDDLNWKNSYFTFGSCRNTLFQFDDCYKLKYMEHLLPV